MYGGASFNCPHCGKSCGVELCDDSVPNRDGGDRVVMERHDGGWRLWIDDELIHDCSRHPGPSAERQLERIASEGARAPHEGSVMFTDGLQVTTSWRRVQLTPPVNGRELPPFAELHEMLGKRGHLRFIESLSVSMGDLGFGATADTADLTADQWDKVIRKAFIAAGHDPGDYGF